MAKYNGADFGKLHDRFSLILRKVLKKKNKGLYYCQSPDSSPPPLKKVYSEEHYTDVLSKTK